MADAPSTNEAPPLAPPPRGSGVSRPSQSAAAGGRWEVELEDDDETDEEEEEEKDSEDDAAEVQALQQMSEPEKAQLLNQFTVRSQAATLTEDAAGKVAVESFSQGTAAMLKAMSEEVRETPEKSGWLKRESTGWFSSWAWRWLELKDRRLCWFDGPDRTHFHGVIDFELVEVELERLWDPPAETGATSSSEPPARKARSFCSGARGVCMPGGMFGSADEVSFRLHPAGSNRAFEWRSASVKDGEEWVSAILAHMEEATIRCGGQPRLRADELNTFNRSILGTSWWKVSRISPQSFERIAESGDVLLFRSRGAFPRIIRMASYGGRYDHVGLILKLEGGSVGILEATGNDGVGFCTWKHFLDNEWERLYPEIALRRVRCPRDTATLRALQDWVGTVIGKPYGLSVNKLSARGSTGGGQQDFFCSQLVAEALKVLGVIPRGETNSAEFWPSTFSARSSPIQCSPGRSFDPEDLAIDFSLQSESKSGTGTGVQAKRDVTVSVF